MKIVQHYFDCAGCGHIDRIENMIDHPTRPMPSDLGFCPKCGAEVTDYIREDRVRELLAEYGEDADAFLQSIQSEATPS